MTRRRGEKLYTKGTKKEKGKLSQVKSMEEKKVSAVVLGKKIVITLLFIPRETRVGGRRGGSYETNRGNGLVEVCCGGCARESFHGLGRISLLGQKEKSHKPKS